MNIKYIIGGILLLLLSFLSCNDDESSLETKGYLELGVSKNVEVITRGFDVDDQSLAVDICTGKNDSVVKHFSDYNDMAGERVLLDVGTYKVKVSSNPIAKLDFEKPTFYGDKENVAVTAGKTTPVAVECFLSCVKITTEFTKPVRDKFKSVVARISDKTGAYLDYGLTESRAGYFQPDYILVDLTLENKEGLTFKMSKLIENTEARDHFHLVFDLIESGDNNSGMDFDITINTDLNDETHTVTIPLPETGYGQGVPVIKFVDQKGDTIKDNTVSKDEGVEVDMMVKADISSANIGLQSVTLLAQSTLFEEKQLPTTLNLLSLSEGVRKTLEELGIAVPAKLESPTAPFVVDLSTLVSDRIQSGEHAFTFVALDDMGHESTEKITVRVNALTDTKPLNDYDVWAHYATLRGYIKDATEADKSKYHFQYRKKGEENWTDATGDVTVLSSPVNDVNVTQLITSLEAGATYEYRLINDGFEAEAQEFETEKATILTNGDFEDDANGPWNITDKGANPNSFWSSGNNSFADDLATSVEYNGGHAALLKSKYAGIGGPLGKFAAGNAFIGSFSVLGMNGGVVKLGKGFASRPSVLKGKYNYNPKTVDKYAGRIPKGSLDQCAIYIVLLTETIDLNTTEQETLDWKTYYADKIVAYAELPASDDMSTNDWKDFELKLQYQKMNVKPQYIGVMCSSSRYGDYFQGAEGSELYIDDFVLEYAQEPEVKE